MAADIRILNFPVEERHPLKQGLKRIIFPIFASIE